MVEGGGGREREDTIILGHTDKVVNIDRGKERKKENK